MDVKFQRDILYSTKVCMHHDSLDFMCFNTRNFLKNWINFVRHYNKRQNFLFIKKGKYFIRNFWVRKMSLKRINPIYYHFFEIGRVLQELMMFLAEKYNFQGAKNLSHINHLGSSCIVFYQALEISIYINLGKIYLLIMSTKC